MGTYASRVGLTVFFLVFMTALLNETASADISTGWRPFVLGVQEDVVDDVFQVTKIEFLKNHNLRVKARIRNRSKAEASIALNIAFFGRDKELLAAVSFVPPSLMGGDVEQAELEIAGGAETYRYMRYYQINIVKLTS